MQVITHILVEFLIMMWEIAWGLLFGFILSSIIRAFIPTETISSRLGKNAVGAIGLSTFFGAISSSCSYAAASMARTLVMKGATWSNAVAFMVSSTNLVFEIFIVIVTLLGWAFFGGEVIGGIFFIVFSALLIVWLFPKSVAEEAESKVKESAQMENDPHAHHQMEHDHPMNKEHDHGAMAHQQHGQQPKAKPGFSEKLAQASGHFYMDVSMVGKDILIGIALSAVMMVVVPETFWKTLFLAGNSNVPHIVVLAWNAIVGILIGIFAFVCSVGNIVLANVLWQGGISFGGVIAFILSDLVTFPMLMVYRRYFGWKTMWFLLLVLGVSIFLTSLLLDISFAALHWIPKSPAHSAGMQHWKFHWNYATWLNILFIPASVWYFFYGKKQMSKSN